MTSLGKLFVPAALAAGTVFSAFAIPLSLYGSQPLSIQFKEERVFDGSLRDIATSYLALAGLLSLGASFSTCAAIAWKSSARRVQEAEDQLSKIEQQLKQKEAQLQEALLSDAYLADSGLRYFLDEEVSLNPPTPAMSQGVIASNPPAPVMSHAVVTASVPKPASVPTQLQTAVPLHAAQAFLGFTRSVAQPAPISSTPVEADAIAKMQHLQTQLQHIMSEIETIQSTLRVEPPSSNTTQTTPLNHLAQRFQALDPTWTVQR
ncbi:hypothetical protein LEP3755_47650 [Leptolyngbya sp. NIES-3755]|nr:hypothetical protein LEP3755_47650 [Leptolyngbya sp. NIES-3755]